MTDSNVLIEVIGPVESPFELHAAARESLREAENQTERALRLIGAEGIEVDPAIEPIPMFLAPGESGGREFEVLSQFSPLTEGPMAIRPLSGSLVIAAAVSEERLLELKARSDVIVWANSELTLLSSSGANAQEAVAGHVDCRPFRPGASIEQVRAELGVQGIWNDGHRGRDVVVGIIDEGVDGTTYPVTGGFARPQSPVQPGTASITSHGSMCAADVLIAAPDAKIFDYPFLGVPNSGGALQMFQAVLDSRRSTGKPDITNNSYGFVGVPDPVTNPRHEVHDINHPLHRKVREVVAAGVACFFAAGNCGQPCPSGNCHGSGIGAGRSVHASNSLAEVITVAAVNTRRERIGYSSQGPGMFERQKPDIASYSHIFANFGPGRPGGTAQPFDSGTSAATPVAAGVAALLVGAFRNLQPSQLKDALIRSAINVNSRHGWSGDFGHGVIDAAGAYRMLKSGGIPAV